jgi:hypothetical protein
MQKSRGSVPVPWDQPSPSSLLISGNDYAENHAEANAAH